jgi:glutamate 5-kinase
MAKTDEKGAEDIKSKETAKTDEKGAEDTKSKETAKAQEVRTESAPVQTKAKEERAWYRLKPGLRHVILTEDGNVEALEPGDEIELSPAGVRAFGDKFEKV